MKPVHLSMLYLIVCFLQLSVAKKTKQVPGYEDGASSMATKMDEVRGRASSISTKMEEVPQRASSVTTKMEEVRGRASSLTTKMEEVPGRASSMATKIEEVRGRASSVTTKMEEVRGRASSMATKMDEVRGRASSVTSTMEEVPGKASSVATKMEEVPGKASSVTTKMEEEMTTAARNEISVALEAMDRAFGGTRRFGRHGSRHSKEKVIHRTSPDSSADTETTADSISAELIAHFSAFDLAEAASEGVGSMAACAVAGCSSAEWIELGSSTAISVAVTGLSLVSPILGVVATLAASFLTGLLGGSSDSDSALEALYETIIASVTSMIDTALMQSKIDTFSDTLQGIAEELVWVPELVNASNNSAVETSYLLTVQHSLAVNSRAAFGECYSDPDSDACAEWEEAGTIVLANFFAQVHLQVLATLFGLDDASSAFVAIVQDRLLTVANTYRALLIHSSLAYEAARLSQVKSWSRELNWLDYEGANHKWVCKDMATGTIHYENIAKDEGNAMRVYTAQAEAACEVARAAWTNTSKAFLKGWLTLTFFVEASCDASADLAQGTKGDCTNELLSGDTCQPTCDAGWSLTALSSCNNGSLTSGSCQECITSCPPGQVLEGTCGEMSFPQCRHLYCEESNGVLSDMNCDDWNNCNYKSQYADTFEDGSKTSFTKACCVQGHDARRRRCR